MIIDRAKEDDIGRLEELWCEAFGDDKEIIELFMSKVLNSTQTYVVRKSGIIVSVLYALPTIDDNYYLYALATDTDYRNRGYMSALIRYFIDHFDAGYFFLIPGEEELVSYYEELGFDVHVPAGIRSNVKNIFNESVTGYVIAEIKADDGVIPDLPDALVCVKHSAAPDAVYGLIPY